MIKFGTFIKNTFMKLKFLLISILLLSLNSYACKCVELEKETMVEDGIEKADIIFYGELIKVDTIKRTFQFKIYELFKGNYSSTIINGVEESNNCNLFPDKKGLWIIYGNFNENRKLVLSTCSPSQSQIDNSGFPPIPFTFDSNGKIIHKSDLEMKIFNLENQNKAFQTFYYQLEKLRNYKLASNTIISNQENDLYNKIIVSLLTSNLLFVGILIYILFRKKMT